jgi:hypothetical protein
MKQKTCERHAKWARAAGLRERQRLLSARQQQVDLMQVLLDRINKDDKKAKS